MYKGDADWTLIGEIKNNPRMNIPVFGNGDVDSPIKAKEMKEKYGVDGIMIGRAAIGYPWIFNEIKHYLKTGKLKKGPDMNERIRVCKNHLKHSIAWKGERLGVVETRRHYTNYFRSIPNFKPYKKILVSCDNPKEIFSTLDEISFKFSETTFD